MARASCLSLSWFGFTGRAFVAAVKSTLLGVLVLMALGAPSHAFAGTTTTTLTVTSGGNAVTTVPAKTVVTLTATAKAGTTPVKVGQVNFCDAAATHCTDIHILGTQQLTSAGTAILKFVPGIGSHSYKAVFLGTTSETKSSSSLSSLTVTTTATGKSQTTTTLSASGTPADYTLTATVTGYPIPGLTASPTGTVSFLDTTYGNNELGSANLGTGTQELSWAAIQTPLTAYYPTGLAVADFNGDGIPDVATFNRSTDGGNGSITVLLGNGDGTFITLAASPSTGYLPRAITAGDFNGDGIPDLAVVSLNGVTILLGNGDGTFNAAPSPSIVPGTQFIDIVAADFNGDGIEDLAVLSEGDYGNTIPSVTILLGNGDGTFVPMGTSTPTSESSFDFSYQLAAGDFNGDGKVDLAVADGGSNKSNGELVVLLGNGDGTFRQPISEGARNQIAVAVADFNGDGKADLVAYNWVSSEILILLGNGSGGFGYGNSQEYPISGVSGVVVADFNGDGKPDVAVMSNFKAPVVLLGNGDGTFTTAASPAYNGDLILQAAAGDFNGDGLSDLAAVWDGLTVELTQQTPTATATLSGISVPPNSGVHQVEASYPGDTNYDPSDSTTVGISQPPPVVTLSATSLSYGNQEVGTTSASQQVTLTNTGLSTLVIASMTVTGADASSFVFANNCGTTLASGASCTTHGHFTPSGGGALTAAITITDNASGSPQSITLNGTGTNTTVSLSASSLSFGTNEVGTSSVSQHVLLTNTGSATLFITSITETGADASSFVVAWNTTTPTPEACGPTLAAAASCLIHGHFTPTAAGALTATVTIADSASGSPQIIALTGTGENAGSTTVSLSATSVSFGPQAVGTASASQSVTLTNTGSSTLYFAGVSVTGVDASSFDFASSCGSSVAVGGSCLIHGHFTPAATGALTAALTIADSAAGSPQTIALSGTGR